MSRTTRLPLAAMALLALLAPLTVAVADSGAARAAEERSAANDLGLSTAPDRRNPLKVDAFDSSAPPPPSPEACVAAGGDPGGDVCQDVLLTVRGETPLRDVTVTVVESRGLYVDPMVTTIADTGDSTTAPVGFVVQGRTPGLHTLTFEVSSPDAATRSISLPYVWRPGASPRGYGSLSGRLYGANVVDSYDCGAPEECTYRSPRTLSFVSKFQVVRSLAIRGAQRACGPASGCPRYHYDRETHLVQIGRGHIGRLSKRASYVDGESYVRMVYPRRGQRLEGEWQFVADVDEGRGIVEQRLVLRSNGRFRLAYAVDTHRYPEAPSEDTTYERRMSGTYRVGRNGRLRLNDNLRKLTEIATLALVTSPTGYPEAESRGIWLNVSVDPTPAGKRFIDGNLMDPVPGPAGRD